MVKKNKDHKDVNWYEDKYQAVLVWRNWLILFAMICLVGLVVMAFIILSTLPLKTVKPYVIQIDENSGRAIVVQSKDDKKLTRNEAIIRYFVRNYIEAREGYDPNTYKKDYYKIVNSMSNLSVYNEFQDYLKTSNNSPLLIIAGKGVRQAEITDLELVNENEKNGDTTWRVFFNVVDKMRNSRPVVSKARAIMHINFADRERLGSSRIKYNPLSIIVKRYRADYNIGG